MKYSVNNPVSHWNVILYFVNMDKWIMDKLIM